MAFTNNKNLKKDPNVLLRDQQHAARVFVDNQFRLAPKFKFNFHVAFGINPAAVFNGDLVQRYGQEINLLVKSVDLPSFKIETEMLNQYNRKKVVQYQYKPQEIGVTFHDDNMGLINQLWQNYYSYYYADSRTANQTGAYDRTATRRGDYLSQWNYGFDNGSTVPFFKYIKLYQMARHEYVMYQLWNPIVTNWNHNKLDYAQAGTHDFSMKLLYEAVTYETGDVDEGAVEGFGMSHYDHTPSPLSGINPDPTVNNPSISKSLDLEAIAPSFLTTALDQLNTAQNTKTSSAPYTNIGATTVNTASSPGGVAGVAFPVAAGENNAPTVAKSTNLTGG
jgi:hypothetical protein